LTLVADISGVRVESFITNFTIVIESIVTGGAVTSSTTFHTTLIVIGNYVTQGTFKTDQLCAILSDLQTVVIERIYAAHFGT
jgi:hypothetical protein